ncbi:MAG: TonB-dependent receptor, partial [Cyclobacteriaceae bacterium]
MKFTLVVIILICSEIAFSQSIQLLEKNSGEPIPDVFVYDESQQITTSSDENGRINLDEFPSSGKIIFQHPGFEKKIISAKKVKSLTKIELIDRVVEFDDVVISANRWSQNPSAIAQDITSVSKKTIEFSNPATSADLLEYSGEVFVQKSQFGGGSPMLRGFAANSVLLVVDGVRLNNAIYRSGNLQNIINIDPNALSKAEVIYGPGSIIYGSDALGGVMSFNTISPSFSEDLQIKVNVLGRYSSAANENTGHLSTEVSTKNFNYFGSFSYSNFGDLRAGSNRSSAYQGYFERNFYVATLDGADFLVPNDDPDVQVQSGFNLFSAINKFRIKTGAYSDLELALYISQSSDIPRYDRLALNTANSDSLTYAEWYYGPQEWLLNRYTFNYYKPNSFFDETRITFGYQRYHESRNDRRFGSESLRSQMEEVDLYTLNIDFNKSFGEDHIYYGVDLFSNLVTSNAFRTDLLSKEKSITDSRYPNEGSTYQSFAFYLNYLKELKQWTFGVGTRYSAIRLSAKTSNSQIALFDGDYDLNNQAINGMLSLVYRPNKNHKVSGIASSGFRAPN